MSSRVLSLIACAVYSLGISVVCAVAVNGGGGGGADECYVNYDRSCGAFHVESGRVCGEGANATPCGDIILSDSQIGDVRGAAKGESGKQGPVNFPTAAVSVTVHLFRCNGSACQSNGIKTKTCQGREATGSSCVGQS